MNLKLGSEAQYRPAAQVYYQDKQNHHTIIQAIRRLLPPIGSAPIIIVCIGSDRSTGDALGPLVGSRLEKWHLSDVHVYGTLNKPVHAMNLHETLALIDASYKEPFIVGIDACLGRYQNIGNVTVSEGPVLPGTGVRKELRPVGNMNITGVVNVGGFMEYSILQNTRLHVVMSLSQVISQCFGMALLTRKKKPFLSGLLRFD